MVLGFYPPQIPPGWSPSQPPALSLLSVVRVLPAPNPSRLVAFPTPPRFFPFGFWGFTRPKFPQVDCLPNSPALSLLWVFGVLPAPNPPRLVAFPIPRDFFAFGLWGFTRPNSPQVGCHPNPPRFLCFRFLGFYPPQIPPGWLPSQSPALSLLSVFGVLPTPNPHRLVAFPTPPRFLCFGFLGFYPPQIPPGWLPSQSPAISLLSVFGVLPAPIPPRLDAIPTPRAFFAFGFWGFTRPKSPQVGCLPNPPRFLCFRFLGFYPPQTPTGWLPSQLPRAFFALGFWGFTHPKPPQVGCLPNPTLFLCFPVFGFYPPQTPRSILPDHSRYLCLSSTTQFDYYLNLCAFQ